MFARLLLLFVLVPLIELALLLYISERTGWTTTLAIVIVTGIVGTMLAKSQGFRAAYRIRQEMSQGRTPNEDILDAIMILGAAMLLLTPGILTDAFGLSLLIPWCRRGYRAAVARWFRKRFDVKSFTTPPSAKSSDVVDSYAIPKSDEKSTGSPEAE